ncbi:hypothetical protein BDV93DRAFT_514473 [Ceratobasidium sp. AG-I]|nr:hypothetical protein BDV93DRAFT_514473 [Ceratobasidium sp. AG-I]
MLERSTYFYKAFMDYYKGQAEFHPDKWDYKELKASYDQAFSEMGNIHTKRRARLGHEKFFDTAIVQMELERTHTVAGLTCACLKHQFRLSQDDLHNKTAEEIGEDTMVDHSVASDITALAARLHQDVVDDEDPPEDKVAELSLPACDFKLLR